MSMRPKHAFGEEAPETCERPGCEREIMTHYWQNGQRVCPRCRGEKMGYYAEPRDLSETVRDSDLNSTEGQHE